MPYCQKCGEELAEGVTFCSSCGAQVGESKPVHRREDRGEACFGPPGSGTGEGGVISGSLISVGIFLIGLVVLWYYDLWWPGILILIALMAIIGGIVAYTRRS